MDQIISGYHDEWIESVSSRIKEGEKHLSVVMSVGLGVLELSLRLVNRLISEGANKVAMVFRYIAAKDMSKKKIEEMSIDKSVYCYSVRDFIISAEKFDYIIFQELNQEDRQSIKKAMERRSDAITISFIELGNVIDGETNNIEITRLSEEYKNKRESLVCVYVTKHIFDIRDVRYADDDEKKYVWEGNIQTFNYLLEMKHQADDEFQAARRRTEHLKAYLFAFQQYNTRCMEDEMERLKESLRAEEQERINILLRSEEKDRKIKELEAELLAKEQEKKQMVDNYEDQINLLSAIVYGFGIDKASIKQSLTELQATRELLGEKLNSCDEEIREFALKQLQDKIAELSSNLVQMVLTEKGKQEYTAELIDKLSEEVWNKLDETSKTFLITAKCTFYSMKEDDERESFDYSGVCLLVTKALEVETAKRFFLMYKDYLRHKYNSVAEWPHKLRKRIQGIVTEEELDDSEYTLGSVVSIIGLKREEESDGSTIYTVAHSGTKKEFEDYARKILFNFSDEQKVRAEIKKDYLFIEKVRNDYRNPSAHRNRLTLTSAESCLKYVIDVEKMLKEMLCTMKV